MLADKIKDIAQPLCEAENFELVQIEHIAGDKDDIIRLYMDKPGGITMEDCVYISRQLGDLIDVNITNMGRYRLEVSSPGPKRPLNKKEDFHRFCGERVKIETSQLVEDKKKFTGVLEKINDDSVEIAVDGKLIEIKDHLINKAMLAGQ